MHRPGIEPGPPAWQASILPSTFKLDGRKVFCSRKFFLQGRGVMVVTILGGIVGLDRKTSIFNGPSTPTFC